MRKATVENIDALIEFDTVFNLSPNPMAENSAVYRDALEYPEGHSIGYAPSVYIEAEQDEYGDIFITADTPFIDGKNMPGAPKWEFYSVGYTGQFGVKKSSPVMHASEYVGGRLAQDMITDGGTFAVVEVKAIGDLDTDEDDAVGWVVLRKSS